MGEGEIKKVQERGGRDRWREGHEGRDSGAKYQEEWGRLRKVQTEGGGLGSQGELKME